MQFGDPLAEREGYLAEPQTREFYLNDSAIISDNPLRTLSRPLSGRWIVIGLLLLGVAATSLLFIYWDQHTKPFRPLREAIGREFRHSRPNVEGGRQKGRGPLTLRISMSVEFPPGEDSPQAQKIVDRVMEIARQHKDVSEFEMIEDILIQFVPQEAAKIRTFKMSTKNFTYSRYGLDRRSFASELARSASDSRPAFR